MTQAEEKALGVARTIRLIYFIGALVVIAVLGGMASAFAIAVSDLRAEQREQAIKYEQLAKDFEAFRAKVDAFQSESRMTLNNLGNSLSLIQGMITATVQKPPQKGKR